MQDAIGGSGGDGDYDNLEALLPRTDVQRHGSHASHSGQRERTWGQIRQEFQYRRANKVLLGTEPVLTFVFISCRLPGCKAGSNARDFFLRYADSRIAIRDGKLVADESGANLQ